MSTDLLEIVKANPYFEVLESGKLRCKLTSHELAANLEKYNEYIKSKGYLKAIEKDFDFAQYLPHIMAFKGNKDLPFLWCKLTRTKIPKMKQVILRHVEGKKYKRLFEQFKVQKEERERRKKVTLLKSKRLNAEEEEDRFDGDFIDRMINELEQDDDLEDKDLEGDESDSEDIYSKIKVNQMDEEGEEDEESGSDEEEEEEDDEEEEEEEEQIPASNKKQSQTKMMDKPPQPKQKAIHKNNQNHQKNGKQKFNGHANKKSGKPFKPNNRK